MGSSPAAAAGTALEDLPEDALLCIRDAAAASSPALPPALALRLGLGLPASPARPLLPAPPSPAAARRLHRLRRLLGLWRRLPPSGSPQPHPPAAFEWAPARAALAASLLAPSARGGVARSPFVTLSIADSGDTVAALGDLPVCVNFVGNNHIVVEPAELAHLSLHNVPAVLLLLQSLIVPVSCLLSARGVAGENREMSLLVRAILH